MSSFASSESKVLLCPDCGHIGNRTFTQDSYGVWRDVLGGPHGITPDGTTCSNCGSPRYKLIRKEENGS